MSDSENVKRCLNQAAEMAGDRMQVQDKDIRTLIYQLSQERRETQKLKILLQSETEEKLSHEIKSDTSLIFMFLVCCMSVVAIAIAVLNCK